ncbi:type II toxin-antitoxin system RelE/ParE family toxin [Variovorax sp. GT1P44]|uniref:type II toxin-antitoxin system RelE/ParE family toxin n=1 Tax=Variovorax sp. GT1P44 TaxID=3443742 RepID=UPI003F47E5E3
MRIEWSPVALDDRDRIFDYYDIEEDSPHAAILIDERIAHQIEVLIDHPEFGRTGRVDDTRELVISRTPYVVAYRIMGDAIRILRVLHGKQLWPGDIQE